MKRRFGFLLLVQQAYSQVAVYLLEAVVYLLEAVVYLLEAVVYLLEAAVYLLEAAVYLLEVAVYLLEVVAFLLEFKQVYSSVPNFQFLLYSVRTLQFFDNFQKNMYPS